MQRQYSGTAGRTENCQIGVFAAYSSVRGRALVDRELYLPKSWTSDPGRCAQAKIPDGRAFATKGDLAKGIIMRALASPLPISWVTADSAYGQEWRLRRMLEEAASAMSWPCQSHSTCTPLAASTSPSPRPPRAPGNATPAGLARRGHASTTGPQPGCPLSTTSTVMSHP